MRRFVRRHTIHTGWQAADRGIADLPRTITLDRTAVIQAKAFKSGCLPGFTAKEFFQRLWAKAVIYEFPNSPRYSGGGEHALINGRLGAADDYRSDWVGFQDADLVATIALTQPRARHFHHRAIPSESRLLDFLPVAVQYEVSSDGVNYRTVFEKNLKLEAGSRSDVTTSLPFRLHAL